MKDPKETVRKGYDELSHKYSDIRATPQDRDERYLQHLFNILPDGARVLDLGCGSGIGITERLADHYEVTGVDISEVQIESARRNIPDAVFYRMDMNVIDRLGSRFDAVTAFFSIIHIPREEHSSLIQKIHDRIDPDGYFLANLGSEDIENDFAQHSGIEMYWSHFDADVNIRLLKDAGFRILKHSVEGEEFAGKWEEHLYVLAQAELM